VSVAVAAVVMREVRGRETEAASSLHAAQDMHHTFGRIWTSRSNGHNALLWRRSFQGCQSMLRAIASAAAEVSAHSLAAGWPQLELHARAPLVPRLAAGTASRPERSRRCGSSAPRSSVCSCACLRSTGTRHSWVRPLHLPRSTVRPPPLWRHRLACSHRLLVWRATSRAVPSPESVKAGGPMAVHVEVKQGQLLRRCPLARLRHQAARATSRAAPFCWWLAVRVGVGSPLARRRCARSLQASKLASTPRSRSELWRQTKGCSLVIPHPSSW